MRHKHLVSKWVETGIRQGLFRRSLFVILSQLSVALIAVNVYGQSAFLSSPKELLAADPRAVAEWLESNRPKPVPADQKARILKFLPNQGEVKRLNLSLSRKLTSLGPLLRAAERDSAYEIKVVDVPQVRIVLHERTVLMISANALTQLEAEELQALVAHEIGHEVTSGSTMRARPHATTAVVSMISSSCATPSPSSRSMSSTSIRPDS